MTKEIQTFFCKICFSYFASSSTMGRAFFCLAFSIHVSVQLERSHGKIEPLSSTPHLSQERHWPGQLSLHMCVCVSMMHYLIFDGNADPCAFHCGELKIGCLKATPFSYENGSESQAFSQTLGKFQSRPQKCDRPEWLLPCLSLSLFRFHLATS